MWSNDCWPEMERKARWGDVPDASVSRIDLSGVLGDLPAVPLALQMAGGQVKLQAKLNVTAASRLRRRVLETDQQHCLPSRQTKRLALPSNIACPFSVPTRFVSSCEPLPPDMIFIIRRPMTLPDSNARDTVEKKGPNIALLSEQRNAAVVKCLA